MLEDSVDRGSPSGVPVDRPRNHTRDVTRVVAKTTHHNNLDIAVTLVPARLLECTAHLFPGPNAGPHLVSFWGCCNKYHLNTEMLTWKKTHHPKS